jgi:hypothetical protein
MHRDPATPINIVHLPADSQTASSRAKAERRNSRCSPVHLCHAGLHTVSFGRNKNERRDSSDSGRASEDGSSEGLTEEGVPKVNLKQGLRFILQKRKTTEEGKADIAQLVRILYFVEYANVLLKL